ncbi:hypothetical protein I4U23_024958 [Adineta vaga]|nr:hypothetical protein I4U23_024958 [Adineta vaga]
MNDPTLITSTHTKKYNIPLTHLEHRYIQQCTDGLELEQIYKELIGGEVGIFPLLVQLTIDRIRSIQPNSEILQQDKRSLDISLQTINISTSENQQNNNNSTSSIPVMSNNNQQSVPKTNAEWENHAQSISHEFNSDIDDDTDQTKNESYETNKRRHIARQYRLNANTAFQSNNYQRSIDLYTESLALDENIIAYFNRAIAYFKLNDYDATIRDCFQILTLDPKHKNALYQRALCYYMKQQYNEAKHDLGCLFAIDSENRQAQDLLQNITTMENPTSSQTTNNNNQDIDKQSSMITSLNIEDESVNNRMTHSIDTNFPASQDIPYHSLSQTSSPTAFDEHNTDQFQISTINDDADDDEDMALGYEAGGGITTNLSDEEARVSPTMDNDSDVPELINHKPLQTPPTTPLLTKDNPIDQIIAATNRQNGRRNGLSMMPSYSQIDDDQDDLYDNYNLPTISNQFSSFKQATNSSNLRTNMNETSMQSTTINDTISNSNFGSLIQSWLRDLVALHSTRYSSSIHGRPWTKSIRPWSLNTIQYDIDRFHRCNDYQNAIEVSKKMLHNGLLDYHYHAEYIVDTLVICAESYLKLHDYEHALQYGTEALQYHRLNGDALLCRAKAFEKENMLLQSYEDYSRIPSNNFNYYEAQHACERLTIELNSTGDDTWRERLQTNSDDDYYLHNLNNSNESYEWYQIKGDDFYLSACFILAIRCYTICIELQPNHTQTYLKRAECYLKVYEPEKTINDCDKVLKEDQNNYLALYHKALAYKISRENYLYESTLKEYLKLQPNNQIVLSEYYTCRHEKIPRKKRRIRINSSSSKSDMETCLSYEELERIRSEEICFNSSISFENTNDLKEQCSIILHSFDSINLTIKKSIEIIINIIQIMIQAEQTYTQEHQINDVTFSYIKYAYDILLQLTILPQIDVLLSMIDGNSRRLLDEELEYYSSMFDDSETLNRLK